MDTPGIIPYQVGRKFKASKSFLTGPRRSLMETELGKPAEAATPVNSCFGTQSVVMVIVDASDKRTREQLHPEVVKVLMSQSHIPAVLVLNKVT